jgi:hypothetical protein
MPSRSSTPLSGLRFALAILAAVLLAGCGSEIGDSCNISQDCDPDGDRVCDIAYPDGYCTVIGCDHDTCPDEAVCVRFFDGAFSNRTCDHATEDMATDMCSPDEICTLQNLCALRSSEARYCMKKCGGGGDCRGGFECRDLGAMKLRGGEPVLPPGDRIGDDPPRFCALAP